VKTIVHKAAFITLVFFNANILTAQEYKIPVTHTGDGRLILKDFIGDLQVEGYEGNEIVFFKTSFGGDKGPSASKGEEEANPSSRGRSDNSGIGLHIEINEDQIEATCLPTDIQSGEYKVKVPDNYSIRITGHCQRTKGITVSDTRNEVEIKNCQSIKLSNTTGSLILSAISGNIEVENCTLDPGATLSIASISGNIQAVLSRVITREAISLNSISGNIVLTLPAKITADYRLKTISGIIKSDFDFPDESKNQVVGTKIDYQSDGDFEIKINTVSGNIYIRKAE